MINGGRSSTRSCARVRSDEPAPAVSGRARRATKRSLFWSHAMADMNGKGLRAAIDDPRRAVNVERLTEQFLGASRPGRSGATLSSR